MHKFIAASSFAALLGLAALSPAGAQTSSSPGSSAGAGAMQMSQAECQALWTRADSANAGSMSQTQAAQYVRDFKSADANDDGKLSSAEFLSACQRGLVQSSASSGAGAGSGSSSSPSGSPSR